METMKEITMNELSEIVSDAGSDETITFTSMYEGGEILHMRKNTP